MGREEFDPYETRTTRSPRRGDPPTDRLDDERPAHGDPVNPDWRARTTRRNRRGQGLPSSRQEFVLWLQYGGWRVLLAAGVLVVGLIGLIYLTRRAPDTPSPFARPTEVAGIVGGAPALPQQATVTPRPTGTAATAAPASSASSGAQFRVFNTGAEGLFLRPDHNTAQPPVKTLADGTLVTIVGEDFSGPDRVWKHVRDPDGSEGWVAADFLQPAQ
ncbi:MAG TPA: SH3 domain-containing protein [Roseiflexaceae bacterium]